MYITNFGKNGCSSNHANPRNSMKITIKLLVVFYDFSIKSFNLLIKKIYSVNGNLKF